MIGTNNLGNSRARDEAVRIADVAAGIRAILEVVRNKAPRAKIILMGITPRNDSKDIAVMQTVNKINERIAAFADGETVVYLNINDKLADRDGRLFEGVTTDRLHLSINGYQIWADALKPLLTQWLGPPAEVDKAPPATGIPTVEGDQPNSP
jgi:lysophospholipase L1-like esterase